MDFGLSEDQSLLQDSLRRWLGERVPLERVRGIMESREGFDAALLSELAAQGVTGVLIGESHGGAGLSLLDAAIVAEELGAAVAPMNFQSACVMAPLALQLGAGDALKRRWLPQIAAGRTVVSYAADAPPVRRGVLDGSVLYVPDALHADAFVVVAGREAYLVAKDAPQLSSERLIGVDDSRRMGELRFDSLPVTPDMRLDLDDAALARIADAGRIALAADALGAAERALERAVAYASQRKQFERVIASFQAVKHMCAEVAAAIEPLRSLVWYAAFAWDENAADAAEMAALAKAHAGDVGVRATTTCIEVFGGMGFTWECDAHFWFKRAGFDRQVLGGPEQMRARAAALTLTA